jgi:hypothetical protein
MANKLNPLSEVSWAHLDVMVQEDAIVLTATYQGKHEMGLFQVLV